MNKKSLVASIIILFTNFLFAGNELSSQCDDFLKDFFVLRMNLSLHNFYETDEKYAAVADIEAFYTEKASLIQSLSEEERLIVENFYVTEKYNYLYEIPSEKEGVRNFLKDQLTKVENYYSDKKIEDTNPWLIATRADVTSCYMGFSVSDVMKYGTSIKPLYEKATQKAPDFSYAYMNLAQYYFWAPGIAGGSKKKAMTLFKTAYEKAATSPELYYACIFYSQALYDSGSKEAAREILNQGFECCPESFYLKKIREVNDAGFSLYEYNRRKSNLKDADKK